ncbi:MAG: alkaline phosphatase family protein [Gammaproteobacteria bacterium]|nr:MAG: alkaline phosphatase family protein [Gammaproteobacteria bacterium]
MNKTLVILVVGLTPDLVGEHTPNLQALAARGALRPLAATTPAVTTSAQTTMLTGLDPSEHGIVANGWYFRDLAEVWLWRQSNHLVNGERLWDAGRRIDPGFTTAKMFWWYNMYSSVEWSATPRPMYPADGRKIPDHYAAPAALHDELDARFGQFPLFTFWGPMADISSSRWISDATRYVIDTRQPTLALTYLPHLDYNLQRLGPDASHPELQRDLRDVDALCGELIEQADRQGRDVIVVSEYGITPVSDAVHINRVLREAGLVATRNEQGREQLDAGASVAFAVADHQIAHIYVNVPDRVREVQQLLSSVDGIEAVLDTSGKRAAGLDHPRSGELVAISSADRWFSYYYWLDEARAPDYARTVDIHRKPGYDPVELFLDPDIRWPKLKVASRLAARRLGFRNLLDVISPGRTDLVRGSHGRPTDAPGAGPVCITGNAAMMPERELHQRDVKALVLRHVFGDKVPSLDEGGAEAA